MKKIILISLLVLAIVYVAVALSIDRVVKAGVNTYAPEMTQSKVVLAGANLSPLTGSGSLSGFVVGNPAGWSERPALSLGNMKIDLEPMSVFGDTIVINEITIEKPEINFETKIFSSNLNDLVKNIEKYTGPSSPDAAPQKPRKFIVKKFRLTNGQVSIAAGTKVLTVDIAPISIDDLGVAEGGVTPGQMAGVLLKKLLNTVVQSAASATNLFTSEGAAMSIEKTKDAARELGEGLKKMFSEEKK